MNFNIASRESDGDEQARLAASPVGSINEMLSHIEPKMSYTDVGMVIELPNTIAPASPRHRLVVVLTQWRPPKGQGQGVWYCTVVASTHPAYPVGGYDIVVSDAQTRRGRRISQEGLLSRTTTEA